ncbi:hypothetical protein Tsubulata_037539, partial [Turnera subulata]
MVEDENLEASGGEVLDASQRRGGVFDCFCSPFSWFKMLANETHWSFVFGVVAVYGINQGLGGAMSRVGTEYYMKDVQKVQPSEAQIYQGITSIPWMVKPIWGLLTDVVPILGYRRRPYLCLAGLLGVVAMLLLSLHENLHIALAVLSLTAGSAAVAVADVTIDACVAQNSNIHPSLAPDMQSLCALSSSIGALIGFSLSGIFVHLIGPKGVLGLLTIPAGLVFLVGVMLDEPPMLNFTYRQVSQKFVDASKAMWTTLKLPDVWRPCLYMYLSLALSLNIREGLFYWYTDSKGGPSFSQETVGFIFSIGSVGSLLGALLYHNILKDHPFRDLLFWTQLLYGLSGMLDLALVLRLNLKLGLPDYLFIVIDESVSQMIGRLKWMPLLVLSAKLCPPGIEGTFFALLMSIDNIGLFSATWGGGLVLHLLSVTRTKFDNLWLAILIRNILRVSPLCVIFLIPRGDPNASLLPAEVLDTKEGALALQNENIELVSLVHRLTGEGMSSQTLVSTDRSRTYWTPTMERYFIDLMLEHTHRGNKTGHTFNKQAWTEMQTVFNERFGSQYDKDVLKSRYTNLWKQYSDVKELLGQGGFSWDETRQLVVADADVWNANSKVRPDMRSYKTKTVSNFNDLCAVFGYTAADGRYSLSSHDADFDDDAQGINGGDGMGTGPSNIDRPRTEWTTAMDQYFIELLLDEIGKGNKTDNTFTKQAWTEMLTFFNAKFGPHHDKRGLRHRYKKLSKYYSDLKVLLQQSGFSWDDRHQMVVPHNDNVWDAYIKAHPHARSYRMKTLPNYNDLVLIFGNEIEKNVHNNLLQSKVHEADNLGVHRGNKFGQKFISQAWADTATSFNVKFQSYYDKYVLKNRYKHLRRLYNDVKSFLENDGFSWNETREMITAEDHVHPDARSYRVKTVPSYQKLCAIFGEETSDGRYSRLAHCHGLNSEAPVSLATGNGPLFCRPHVHERNNIDHTFSEQAWDHMVKQFNEKFGLLWEKNILENRYISLMKECDNIRNLLSHNGFSWDVNQQKITAVDAVWKMPLHIGIESWTVTLISAKFNKLQTHQIEDFVGMETETNIPVVEKNGLAGDVHSTVEETRVSDQQRKRHGIMPIDSKLPYKVQKIGQQEGVTAERKETKNIGSIESAIEALQAIPDIDDELLFDACDLLEDETKAKTFMALNAPLRKKWLLRKLRPQESA